jgi:hypothetical protein
VGQRRGGWSGGDWTVPWIKDMEYSFTERGVINRAMQHATAIRKNIEQSVPGFLDGAFVLLGACEGFVSGTQNQPLCAHDIVTGLMPGTRSIMAIVE